VWFKGLSNCLEALGPEFKPSTAKERKGGGKKTGYQQESSAHRKPQSPPAVQAQSGRAASGEPCAAKMHIRFTSCCHEIFLYYTVFLKNRIKGPGMAYTPVTLALGRRRQKILSLRPAWLHSETLSQNTKQTKNVRCQWLNL
jgi:hypothetical protein